MLNNKMIENAFTGLMKPQGFNTGRKREVARIENRDPSICPVCGDKLNMLQCTSHWAYVCYKDNHAAPVPNEDIPQNNFLVSASREFNDVSLETATVLMSNITQEQWNAGLDSAYSLVIGKETAANYESAFSFWKPLGGSHIVLEITKFFKSVVGKLQEIAAKLGAELTEIVALFKTKKMLALMKMVSFSFTKLYQMMKAFGEVFQGGVMKVFGEIAKSKALEKIQKGLATVDDLLAKYPILRRLTGIALAGFLVWVAVFNTTFVNHPELDYNLQSLWDAAVYGKFDLVDMLASPSAIYMWVNALATLTGMITVPNPVSLIQNAPGSLIMSLVYTAAFHSPVGKHIAEKAKQYVKLINLKVV